VGRRRFRIENILEGPKREFLAIDVFSFVRKERRSLKEEGREKKEA